MAFPIHPHMLRHACGFKLANDGVDTRTIQAYLGHKSIQHTVRYTELPASLTCYAGKVRKPPGYRITIRVPHRRELSDW
jgi:integrase